MEIDFIKSFNSGIAVNFVEKRSLLSGRVVTSYELASPSRFNFLNSITKIVGAIFYRQRNEVINLSQVEGNSTRFLNLLSDDFKRHSSDLTWIKQILPTIETLKKVQETVPLFDCISDLKTVLDKYLREHPISESSSELIKGDAKLLLRAIKNQPDAVKYADDQLKHDPKFIMAAYLANRDSLQYAPLNTILKIVEVNPSYLNFLQEEKLLEIINAAGVDFVASVPHLLSNPKILQACLEKKPSLYFQLTIAQKRDSKNIEIAFQSVFYNSDVIQTRKEEICECAVLYVDNFPTFEKFSAFMAELAKLNPSKSLRAYIKEKHPDLFMTILSSSSLQDRKGRRSW